LLDAAVMLDKTQVEIETGYYMVDLAKVIESKRKLEAADKLEQVRIALSTNNRSLEEADYKALVADLTKRVGFEPEQKFNRDKFDQLRAMMK
jgi:5-bromo-4-chloroindolyl phosphate hydrolysis protein